MSKENNSKNLKSAVNRGPHGMDENVMAKYDSTCPKPKRSLNFIMRPPSGFSKCRLGRLGGLESKSGISGRLMLGILIVTLGRSGNFMLTSASGRKSRSGICPQSQSGTCSCGNCPNSKLGNSTCLSHCERPSHSFPKSGKRAPFRRRLNLNLILSSSSISGRRKSPSKRSSGSRSSGSRSSPAWSCRLSFGRSMFGISPSRNDGISIVPTSKSSGSSSP